MKADQAARLLKIVKSLGLAPILHLSRLSYLTGIVGTAIWGYGDLVL